MSEGHLCPSWAVSVGYLAVACAAVLSNFGSAVRIHLLFLHGRISGLATFTMDPNNH